MIAVAASVVVFMFLRPVQTSNPGIEATVSRVVDGDTIQMANGDVVRLIGLDAPEKDHPYSDDVVESLRSLEGTSVRLEKDKTNKDRYGRYLRYVFLGDKLVNLEMVREGMAYAYIVSPDVKYEREILEAESLARSSKSGIWKESKYSGCVRLGKFHYNAAGDDEKNLEDEFFTMENSCDSDISSSEWKVRNSRTAFSMPEFSIPPGETLKVSSGTGNGSGLHVFLRSERPIWNNKADTIYVRDEDGDIVFSRSYRNS